MGGEQRFMVRSRRLDMVADALLIAAVALAAWWVGDHRDPFTIGAGIDGRLAGALALLVLSRLVKSEAGSLLEESARLAQDRANSTLDDIDDATSTLALMRYNRAQLHAYERAARVEARQAQLVARFAMVVGLLVVGAAIVVLFTVDRVREDTASQYLLALFTTLGTTLSTYVTRTFMRYARDATTVMENYYRRPLSMSYVLMAERIVGTQIGGRDEQRRHLVAALLAQAAAVGGRPASPPAEPPVADAPAEPSDPPPPCPPPCPCGLMHLGWCRPCRRPPPTALCWSDKVREAAAGQAHTSRRSEPAHMT